MMLIKTRAKCHRDHYYRIHRTSFLLQAKHLFSFFFSFVQVDENAQQQPPAPQYSSSLSSTTLQENGSMPNLTETSMTMTTTTTTNDDRDPPSNHPHTLRKSKEMIS